MSKNKLVLDGANTEEAIMVGSHRVALGNEPAAGHPAGGKSAADRPAAVRPAAIWWREVEHSEESACVGAAMLASVAVGVYRDLEDAASAMVRPKGEYRPSGETRTAYEVPYRTYLELYESLYLLFRASTRT